MKSNSFSLQTVIALTAAILLVSCHSASQKNGEVSKSSAPSTVMNIYDGKNPSTIHVLVESPASQQLLSGQEARVEKVAGSSAPNADVSVIKSSKSATDDALTFSWSDSWRAALNFESTTAINVTEYMPSGVVEFDLHVIDLNCGGLAFKSGCGNNCERQVPYLLSARQLMGKGWQHVAVPLQCFQHDGDNFSAVNRVFSLETGGTGKVAIANVQLNKIGKGTVECADYKTLSVTPSMLNEWWSVNWWLPRHEQKLEEIKLRKNAEVIFIGDSITQGWEKDGFNVWNHHYAKYNAVALGFGGDRTENILWRLQHGEVEGLSPKVAVLMFGTNNTGHRHEDPALTAAGIERDINELKARLPNTKILLLAIFPRDEKPTGELRMINENINALIAKFADNKSVYFLNINQAFLTKDGILSKEIMPDLLHPNEKGYQIWADAMNPTLNKLLKQK